MTEKEEAEEWTTKTLNEFKNVMYEEWLKSGKIDDENSWIDGFYRGYKKAMENVNKQINKINE